MADNNETETGDKESKVIGLSGKPANRPTGTWYAAVDDQGGLVEQDGHLVRVRD